MACVIHGYDEALEREQDARNLVYLDQPEIVLGQPLKNLTPHLLAVLTAIKSPFHVGGAFTQTHVAQFLWALHLHYSPTDKRGRDYMAHVASHFSLEQCRDEIAAFMDLQFMDMPRGGKEEKPIASSVAWLVFRFRHEPWGMKEPEIVHTPLRKLYQELRCWMRENEQPVHNQSDLLKSDWLTRVNEALRNGTLKQSELDEWNAKHGRN